MNNQLQIILNEPHKAQKQILTESKRFNVLCCGRRFGKTALAINLMSETALAGYPVGYFAPTYKLLEGTFKETYSTLSPIISRKHDNQFLELTTGGGIEFWSLENPMSGRSRKYKRAILDEAAYNKNLWQSWTEAIRPTLTDLKGDAWFFSTPKGKNDFYKLFMRGKQDEPNWASWQMSTYTNPFIDPAELNDAKVDLPALAFSQEYMAEFNDNVANPFGLAFIAQCTYPLSLGPAVCYGVDLAKSHDWTVIIGLDSNGQVCHFDRFQKDWRQTILTIKSLPEIPIKIDSTGVGDPIAEELQQGRGNVTAFRFSQTSKQQIMEGLAAAIQQRKITFPDGHIKDELENFEYEFTRTGVRYSSPSGLHDDCVCALALAYDQYKLTSKTGNYAWA